jgi:hypothetical protein
MPHSRNKYAIAWGAVVQKDPLVGDFIAYCGLDSESIRGDTKIDKVVEYLEARMPDDITVVGRDTSSETEPTGWEPANVSLTSGAWIEAKTRGETLGSLLPADTRTIESSLLKLEAAVRAGERAAGKDAKVREAKAGAVLARLKEVNSALSGYAPKNKKTNEHYEEMWRVA